MSQVQAQNRALAAGHGYDGMPPELLEKAGLAHELGNLIQVVSSAVNIVARSKHMRTATDLEPVIAGARSSLDRAGSLVRQTLEQAVRVRAQLDHVDVAHCLSDVEKVLHYTWSPDVSVRLSLQPDLPGVKCDALGLHNAILNLALNARDAMPNGGGIVIAAKTILAGGDGLIVQVSVSDTGIGMTEETSKRAFDPFFTTKNKGLGGLGLPMVKRFVQDAAGSISIDSMPGVGTRVILQLPAARQRSQQHLPPSEGDPI